MNGGHAFQSIEDTRGASFHADFHSLRGAVSAPSEPPPSSGRSETATRPYADPFADTMASPASIAGDHHDWCVDVGPALHTMTTFELWEAIERGHVMAWMRVWRDGMECWTPVGEIAEFAWASAGTPDPPGAPEPLEESAPPAEAEIGALPAPPLGEAPPSEPPPRSTIRPVAPFSPRSLGDARWIALGSAVAVAAVVAATFARSNPQPSPVIPVAGAMPTQPRFADVPSPPVTDAPGTEAEAAHHEERGQHRLPRGGGRAYGR